MRVKNQHIIDMQNRSTLAF